MFNSKTIYAISGSLSGAYLASQCMFQPQSELDKPVVAQTMAARLTPYVNKAERPRVFAKENLRNDHIISKMKPMLDEYKPCWFYANHLGYIIASLFIKSARQITYERVCTSARTEAGGLITFDLARSEVPNPKKKAMLIVPGVTGDS